MRSEGSPVSRGSRLQRRMSSSRDRTALAKVRTRPRTWAEARAILLRERGVSLAKVARALVKDLSSVSRVNQGQRRSQEIEAAIATRVGPVR